MPTLIFVSVMFIGLWLMPTVSAVEDNLFVKKVVNYSGPDRLSSGWKERSRTSCCLTCKARYKSSCTTFMYNKRTRLCTPGAGLRAGGSPPTATEGDLYVSDDVNSYQGFSMYYDLLTNTKAYAAYFPTPLNYSMAEATCQSLGSHLFVAKTYNKFLLLLQILGGVGSTWIGLSDRVHESTFVWADDGTVIDPALKLLTFLPFQPDNTNGEDCVEATRWLTFGLNDQNCAVTSAYICEKPVP